MEPSDIPDFSNYTEQDHKNINLVDQNQAESGYDIYESLEGTCLQGDTNVYGTCGGGGNTSYAASGNQTHNYQYDTQDHWQYGVEADAYYDFYANQNGQVPQNVNTSAYNANNDSFLSNGYEAAATSLNPSYEQTYYTYYSDAFSNDQYGGYYNNDIYTCDSQQVNKNVEQESDNFHSENYGDYACDRTFEQDYETLSNKGLTKDYMHQEMEYSKEAHESKTELVKPVEEVSGMYSENFPVYGTNETSGLHWDTKYTIEPVKGGDQTIGVQEKKLTEDFQLPAQAGYLQNTKEAVHSHEILSSLQATSSNVVTSYSQVNCSQNAELEGPNEDVNVASGSFHDPISNSQLYSYEDYNNQQNFYHREGNDGQQDHISWHHNADSNLYIDSNAAFNDQTNNLAAEMNCPSYLAGANYPCNITNFPGADVLSNQHGAASLTATVESYKPVVSTPPVKTGESCKPVDLSDPLATVDCYNQVGLTAPVAFNDSYVRTTTNAPVGFNDSYVRTTTNAPVGFNDSYMRTTTSDTVASGTSLDAAVYRENASQPMMYEYDLSGAAASYQSGGDFATKFTGGQVGFNQNNTSIPSNVTVNVSDISKLKYPKFQFKVQKLKLFNDAVVYPHPSHLASTMYTIPDSDGVLDGLRLPLGIIYAPLSVHEMPFYKSSPLLRCRRCNAYLNPFVTVLDGNTYKCSLCEFTCSIPAGSDMGKHGLKNFSYQMTTSCYDIGAPNSFCTTPPKSPTHIFLLELTDVILSTGYLDSLFKIFFKSFAVLLSSPRSSVCFIGFHECLVLFKFSILEDEYIMERHILPDLTDPATLLTDDFIVQPYKNQKLHDAMSTLPGLLRESASHTNQSCLGSALQLCKSLLTHSGGRIILVCSQLPTKGLGIIPDVEDGRRDLINDEMPTPTTRFYKDMATELSKDFVTVELFLFNNGQNALHEILPVVRLTSGNFRLYSTTMGSSVAQELSNFRRDLKDLLCSEYTIENAVAIRASTGLMVESFYGNVVAETQSKLILPYCTKHNVISFKMRYEHKLAASCGFAYIQCTTFYTTISGERRLRISTLPLRVLNRNSILEFYNGIDQYTLAAFISKIAAAHAFTSSINFAIEAVTNTTGDIVASYHKAIKESLCSNALYLPRKMRHFLFYIHGLINEIHFERKNCSYMLIELIHHLEMIKTISVFDILSHLAPMLFSIGILDKNCNNSGPITKENHPLLIPSAQYINQRESYLLVYGDSVYLFISDAYPSEKALQLLNIDSHDLNNYVITGLPKLNTPVNIAVNNLVNFLKKGRSRPLKKTRIRMINKANGELLHQLLIMDRRNKGLMGYSDFLGIIKYLLAK